MQKELDEYIRLIVKVGLNIQKGQKLVITAPVECADFVRKVSQEAYLSGAKDVVVRWTDDEMARIKYLNAPDEIFDDFPAWTKLMMDSLSKEGAAFLSVSAANPEALLGVEHGRIVRFQKAAQEALSDYRNRAMSNEVQWCVASVPTVDWAKKVFPNELDGGAAVQKLWDAIFSASRVNGSDTVKNWVEHKDMLERRSKILNDYNFKALKYKNSIGTDLEIELAEGHIWAGGQEKSKAGLYFMANIPTEEVFTAPKRNGANGRVVSTKPLVHNGNLIEDFAVEFKDGRVTSVTAKKNAEVLEQLVHSTKNADYLGEVALVPYNSPISKSEILFYNTLYDENASCHLAFGKAYPACVAGAEGKTDEQLEQMGINVSHEHSDFMIGSKDLNITGITHDGREIPVFIDGDFAI